MTTVPAKPEYRSIWQLTGLICVIVAQCLGTSLWFSPAGAASGLMLRWDVSVAEFAWLLVCTQIGFIAGTLILAFSGVADRVRASRLFALSCLTGALINAVLMVPGVSFGQAWWCRILVGVCLAGIYPLGMKLVVQWVGHKPALALAWLVGMLTVGTAVPHILRALGVFWPWQYVIGGATLLAMLGGLLVFVVGDGPHRVMPGAALRLDTKAFRTLTDIPSLRASAGGYFGHMWELYALWAVVPVLCASLAADLHAGEAMNAEASVLRTTYWLVALVIAIGAAGCLLGGYISQRVGSPRVAFAALAGSGFICLVYPVIPPSAVELKVVLLLCWGVLVVADSPQFSAMSSEAAPPRLLGMALLLQNGTGFLISAISILLLSSLIQSWGERALWVLLPGPLVGLWAMHPLLRRAA